MSVTQTCNGICLFAAAPAPQVDSGVPVRRERCGEVVSITCSASVLDNFVARPVIAWYGSEGQTVNDETLDTSLTSPGEYTCVACVTVETVGIVDLCSNTSVGITSEGVCMCVHAWYVCMHGLCAYVCLRGVCVNQ